MWPTLRVAQEVGARLGERALVFRRLPHARQLIESGIPGQAITARPETSTSSAIGSFLFSHTRT